jgi:hypothetical protein
LTAKPAQEPKRWGRAEVESLVQGFDLDSPPPGDERLARAMAFRFLILELALIDGGVDAEVRPAVARFLETQRPRLYAWLKRRWSAKPSGWSLAELEAAPFFKPPERRRWSRYRNPQTSARFTLALMVGRAQALFKLMSGVDDDQKALAAQLRAVRY